VDVDDRIVRILIVEEIQSDVNMIKHELEEGGVRFTYKVVKTGKEFIEKLQEFRPDIVITDYSIPGFDVMNLMLVVKDLDPNLPVIVLTGTIDKEAAVACMKSGAADYVLKDDLSHLVPAVNGALVKKEAMEKKDALIRSLEDSEARCRFIFDELLDVILIIDGESGEILSVNKASRRILGFRKEELVGKHFSVLFTSLPHLSADEILKKLRIHGSVFESQEIVRSDGSICPVDISATTIPWGDDKAVLVIIRDITERKRVELGKERTEAELRLNYELQRMLNSILQLSMKDIPHESMLEQTLDSILSVSLLGIEPIGAIFIVEESDPGNLVLKTSRGLPEELKSRCSKVPFDRCLCGLAASSRDILFADSLDERHVVHYVNMKPHGHYCVPIIFAGEVLGLINLYMKEGYKRDPKVEDFLRAVANTLGGIIKRWRSERERERIQTQLLHSMKLEAVGQLAGGIAHDFNNMLTAIIGYGNILKMNMKKDDPLRSNVDIILSSADRAANLTQGLLAFSRKQIINPRPVRLNDIIRNIEKLLQRLITEEIEFKILLNEDELTVMADRGQIEQVLMNLVTNARDAMPEGGILTLETGAVTIDREFVRMYGYGNPGEYALISVSDTGEGMDRETMDRIFEPFFTTKEVGRGTGLGLALVYGIIKQHNGYINVSSESGRGTTFRIYLPIARQTATEQVKNEIYELPGGTETILVVDDSEDVRGFVKDVLKLHGYKVIEAEDGERAIEKFSEHGDSIKMIVTDVVMPKMSGKRIYEELKKIKPDIKVLYTSGYTSEIIHQKGVLDEGMNFLSKPLTPEKLLTTVRTILDSP
jgi:PAS domain S-box-containing protein